MNQKTIYQQTHIRYFLLNLKLLLTVDPLLTIVHESENTMEALSRHLTDGQQHSSSESVRLLFKYLIPGETNWFSPEFLQIATDNCPGCHWDHHIYPDTDQYLYVLLLVLIDHNLPICTTPVLEKTKYVHIGHWRETYLQF